MSQYGLFFDSLNGDRKYNAASFEEWLRPFFVNGVFNGQLQVTADTGMKISVGSGYAFINGKVMNFEGTTSLTLSNASGITSRTDTIVVERNDSDRLFQIKVLEGTSTTPPTPVRTGGVYQLVLAHVAVTAGATAISQSDITDKRTDSDLCGYVCATVDEIDFDQIYAQFTSWFTEYKTETTADMDEWIAVEQADFLAWYDRMKDQLDQDAAGHLQNEIDAVDGKVDSLAADVADDYQKKIVWTDYIITAEGWVGNMYSFESVYPSTRYDFSEILTQYGATEDQREAWNATDCNGRYPANVIYANGDVPTIDIPVAIGLIDKTGGES